MYKHLKEKGKWREWRYFIQLKAFDAWCKRQGIKSLNHSNFSTELFMICENKGYYLFNAEREVKKKPSFLLNNSLTSKINHIRQRLSIKSPFKKHRRGYLLRPKSLLMTLPINLLIKATPFMGNIHPSLDQDFYKNYMNSFLT